MFADVVKTVRAKFYAFDDHEATAAVSFCVSVAFENAMNRMILEALASELSVPDVALADSPRSRRNARRRGRAAWLAAAFDETQKIERKTNRAQYEKLFHSIDDNRVAQRVVKMLTDSDFTKAVFDGETGLPVYSRERSADTIQSLVAESRAIERALLRVGAFNAR